MRLKRLELQGYKSFASRTEFVFDDGITAIVGPNGSGKSNIADAIRWVLGEQSYLALRGKRTEDMIFSGSAQRSRLGMAQVVMTLDNEDHSLPIEYSEVTIERRAYRSGENEYRINGNRVRLRDISDLLSAAGLSRRTYAVIGQGLVDAALSLRPEERRALFEEAAGLTAYQAKRDDAVNRLRETTQNIIRVNDIVNEIQPRLKRLAKQAEQAREYQRIDEELRSLLREWYGFRWQECQHKLADAQAAVRNQEKQVHARQDELEALERKAAEMRLRQSELRQQLGEWHRHSSQLHSRSEVIQRDLAVRQERRRQMGIQREELARELIPLQASREGQAERSRMAESELARLQEAMRRQQELASELEAQLAAFQSRRKELLAALTEHQNRVLHVSTQIADHQSRIAQLADRREALHAEQHTHRESQRELESKLAAASDALSSIRQSLDSLEKDIAAAHAERERLRSALAGHREKLAALQTQGREAKGHLEQLRIRYEGLSRLRADMSDYYAGVRAVLGAAAKAQFAGLLGTVAELVQVEPKLEKAIEVAMGNHLQDIVAETWQAAQSAIEYLKRNRAGRATFLPLDSLRPTRPIQSPRVAGVIGLALDLVSFDEKLRPVFELVLGHTIIVENLDVAHRVFKQLSGGFQIVTPDGEIVRSSGAISGGSEAQRQRGLLTREREWRELPDQIRQAAAHCADIEQQEAALAQAMADLAKQIQESEERVRQLEVQRADLLSQQEKRRQDMAQLRREQQWHESLISRAQSDLAGLDAKDKELRGELEALASLLAEAESLVGRLSQQIAELDNDPIQGQMAEIRTRLALSQQTIENQKVVLENHRRSQQDIERQIAAKTQRANELSKAIELLDVEIAGLSAQAEQLSGEIARLAALIQPAEADLDALDKSLEDIKREESSLRSRLRAQESLLSQVSLDAQRRRDELEHLHRQIQEDLGSLVETEPLRDVETQQPLPLKPFVERLPTVTQITPGLESEIRRLKAQKQRLGVVNPAVLEEYNEARERYEFLTAQAADLEEAAASLQKIIADLDELMAEDFVTTFRAIAAEFKTYFTELFGGGAAKIVLTAPDDPLNSGIDIIARPPGKRQQSLNLLSGGERALTAAALIFAILKVSPTPFCVLDEVDAMLDEANVGRFRDTLRSLAQDTQFILITHNRRTIEAAQTIYGVSMGEDHTSVVVSLKLEEATA